MPTIEIKSCSKCPHHDWISNPDPDDWFRDDEANFICTKKKKVISYSLDVFEQAKVNKIPIPKWCPLIIKKKKVKK
jgi:hypothetical protein